MKILMTTDTVGGVWTYAIELARSLRAHGVEFALATMGGAMSDAQKRQAQELDNVKLFESQYKLEWMPEPWVDVDSAGYWLRDLAAKFEPDVVHLNGYAHGALAWDIPTLIVAHSCVLSWWQAVKHQPAPAEWDEYRRRVSNGLRGVDAVVAPSQAMLDAIHRYYGSQRVARVIYNGRDPARFSAGEKLPVILSAGRFWDEAKNLAALDRAATMVKWPVFIAGDGVAGEHVASLGMMAEAALALRLASASIYALPAKYEPFGLSILEAGMSGCALVLGDIPSLRQIWGDAALFVPPEDSAAIARAIQRLISDQHLRAQFSVRARMRAMNYTARRMAEAYLALYHKLLAGRLVDFDVQAYSATATQGIAG